ncbi:hypothetical protein D8Y20_11190 [Mariprofundus sp. EBB-1]|uniref:hypothetical protein n=1 Tax=Mariprofundus sp. EBB-1 TaxID=2650971 RepID=UPI000F271193|nr:hypothetical protein [Mariprofundus sp. EBB-1]RLL50743.1 hypothetical protein D8Y20_11190 [Mariprofundus sp. EBB-1]
MRAEQQQSVMTSHSMTFLFILLLIAPSAASAEENTNAKKNSIHFISLPYLHGFYYDQNKQASIVHNGISRQDLSDHNWIISVTTIPDLVSTRGNLETMDSDQNTGFRLARNLKNIIIKIPAQASIPLPLHRLNSATSPLWLQYTTSNRTVWHSPNLTPKAMTQRITATKEAERLSKRMADRAFYFGYDTNEDALK